MWELPFLNSCVFLVYLWLQLSCIQSSINTNNITAIWNFSLEPFYIFRQNKLANKTPIFSCKRGNIPGSWQASWFYTVLKLNLFFVFFTLTDACINFTLSTCWPNTLFFSLFYFTFSCSKLPSHIEQFCSIWINCGKPPCEECSREGDLLLELITIFCCRQTWLNRTGLGHRGPKIDSLLEAQNFNCSGHPGS